MAGKTNVVPPKYDPNDNTSEVAFILSKDGERVGVDDYGKDGYKFMPDDNVYLCSSGTREGPYRVEGTKDGKYILCDNDGNTIKDGEMFEEGDLVLYDPFAATS